MRLEFRDQAFDDLQFWVSNNTKLLKKIMRLIEESKRDPYGGIGKPEALKKRPLGMVV